MLCSKLIYTSILESARGYLKQQTCLRVQELPTSMKVGLVVVFFFFKKNLHKQHDFGEPDEMTIFYREKFTSAEGAQHKVIPRLNGFKKI